MAAKGSSSGAGIVVSILAIVAAVLYFRGVKSRPTTLNKSKVVTNEANSAAMHSDSLSRADRKELNNLIDQISSPAGAKK